MKEGEKETFQLLLVLLIVSIKNISLTGADTEGSKSYQDIHGEGLDGGRSDAVDAGHADRLDGDGAVVVAAADALHDTGDVHLQK